MSPIHNKRGRFFLVTHVPEYLLERALKSKMLPVKKSRWAIASDQTVGSKKRYDNEVITSNKPSIVW